MSVKAILTGQKVASASDVPEHIVIADSFEWGDQSEVGDEKWWLGLQSWIADASDEELEARVGMKKKVSLSQPVAGWEKASMICIGANIDGDKTLTFQTEYYSPETVKFSDTSAEWDKSNAQTLCNNFAEYCSANKALKTVTIKYRKELSGTSRNLPADSEYECKCFLPSECQMGLDQYSASQDEWIVGGKEEKYPYYIDDTKRKKYKDTQNGSGTNSAFYYWERSRDYSASNANRVCFVYSNGQASGNVYWNSYGLAPIFVIGTSSSSFDWGDEEGEATLEWWQALRLHLADASEAELATYLGKTKKVVMTEPILGTAEWLAQCIGYNCDRDKNNPEANCLTFQSKNCFNEVTAYDDLSSVSWSISTARELCKQVYDVLPFKSIIAELSKGTSDMQNTDQIAPVEYTYETVFLPSDCEMGFIAGHTGSDNKGYAASYDEFCKHNTGKVAYQFYKDNSSRIKNADGYWERSRCYNSSTTTCIVYGDGTPNYLGYNGRRGLAPAFAVAAGLTNKVLTIDDQIPKITTLYDNTTGEIIAPKTTIDAIQGLSNMALVKKVPLREKVKSEELKYSDTFRMEINGEEVEMLIVHKGNPNTEMYDKSCNGIWAITKDCYTKRRFHGLYDYESNDYENSDINVWLNNDFYQLINNPIKPFIKQVKIPYRPGEGTGTDVNKGENGLSCYCFLLGCYEVGFTTQDNSDMPIDGVKLDYFQVGNSSNANTKRIANLDDAAIAWWLRTPRTSTSTGSHMSSWRASALGELSSDNTYGEHGIRPCLILSDDTPFYRDSDGNIYTQQAYQYSITDLDGTPLLDAPGVQMETGSYDGTGTVGESTPNSIKCSFPPKIVYIMEPNDPCFGILYLHPDEKRSVGIAIPDMRTNADSLTAYVYVKSGDKNEILWYNTYQSAFQLNSGGRTYYYLALG